MAWRISESHSMVVRRDMAYLLSVRSVSARLLGCAALTTVGNGALDPFFHKHIPHLTLVRLSKVSDETQCGRGELVCAFLLAHTSAQEAHNSWDVL